MLAKRPWVPTECETLSQGMAAEVASQTAVEIDREIHRFVEQNRTIHELECVNLNPATNVMNPRAEALLAQGLGSRPSLGYPGDKYEMGLEAIERIEIITAELAAEIFGARYAEIRVGSGALANLYVFMATAKPGDNIITPPAGIGGHVTHQPAGAAGLYGVISNSAPIDPIHYTVSLDELRAQARRLRPKLITIGGSLNPFPHPVREIRSIADEVGAWVLYDAAHMSGLIAGKAWQQPLEEGAHVMTMSTYKSLGGPPAGLILTNDQELAQRIDQIAFPGLTANFDVGNSAALAMTLLDWKVFGRDYAQAMADTAKSLAVALSEKDVPIFGRDQGFTKSHQFAIEAGNYGGGQSAAKRLRAANILTCGIGLPVNEISGDVNGLRIGTPEIVRWGMAPKHMPQLASYVVRGISRDPDNSIAREVSEFRSQFTELHYIR